MNRTAASLLFLAAVLPATASAATATFATSDQSITFTGLGGTNGVGESRVTWGSCVFDGTNTKCTVTATYTGIGGGGVLTELLTYPGNGPSPLTAVSAAAGSDRIFFRLTAGSASSLVVSLKENAGPNITFTTPGITFEFLAPTCTGISGAGCGPGQVGLTPNATISGFIKGTFDPTPVITSVISASNYGGFSSVAPGTWMEIYGSNLANVRSQVWSGSDFNGNAAPVTIGGTSVTIGGQSAFTYFVSPTQINAQVPSNVAPGSRQVIVTNEGGSSIAAAVNVNATQPGLLSPPAFKLAAGQYVTALFPDNTTFVLPPNAINGIRSARAKPGDTIILYGVGFGPVTPDTPAGQIVTQANRLAGTVQVSFAGVPATVSFSGLTGGYLGLYQFNVVVPNVAPSDSVPVTFSLAGTPGTQQLIAAIANDGLSR